MIKSILATVFQAVGLVAVSLGAFTVSTTVGLVVSGAASFFVGYRLDRLS